MFTLQLETGLAQAIEKSTLLSTSIVRDPDSKFVFHSEFDNFDQLISLTTGKDFVHTAHGIILQDFERSLRVTFRTSSQNAINEEDTSALLTRDPHQLPECYISERQSPQLTIKQTEYEGGEEAFHEASLKQTL